MTDQLAVRLHEILASQNEQRRLSNGWRAGNHDITLFHEQDDTMVSLWRLVAKVSYRADSIEVTYRDYVDGVFIWVDRIVSLADPDLLYKVQKYIDLAYELDRCKQAGIL